MKHNSLVYSFRISFDQSTANAIACTNGDLSKIIDDLLLKINSCVHIHETGCRIILIDILISCILVNVAPP